MTLKDIVERLERIERINRYDAFCERCDKEVPLMDEVTPALAELKRDIEMYLLRTTGTL